MKILDLLSMTIENQSRRTGRVLLTGIGVAIGTASVVVLVSLGVGLQARATEQLAWIGDVTQITINPRYEEYVEDSFVGSSSGSGPTRGPKMLTEAAIEEISQIEGVLRVYRQDFPMGSLMVKYGQLEGWPGLQGVEADSLEALGYRIAEGELLLERGTVVIGSAVNQNFMDPRGFQGEGPPEYPDLMGEMLRITLLKWDEQGNEIKRTFQVRVVGVLRETRSQPDWMMYFPIEDVEAMNQWFSGRRVNRMKDGYPFLIAQVAHVDLALPVTDQINEMGYMAWTAQDIISGISSFFLVLQIAFGGVGAISLLVAAIGIANTMTMAILERTREIGLLKAVGATNRDVLAIFLSEASGIGLLGGLVGVALGWSLSQVLNVLALAYFASQAIQGGGPPSSVAVLTPAWLPPFAVAFATLIGLVSGIYPALRAASLVPVAALRYE